MRQQQIADALGLLGDGFSKILIEEFVSEIPLQRGSGAFSDFAVNLT